MEESQTPVLNDGGGRVNERRTQERNSVTRRNDFCELTNTRSLLLGYVLRFEQISWMAINV